jgi:hypothetical protein
MQASRQFISKFFLWMVGLWSMMVLINYIVDPFHNYRKPTFYKTMYSTERYLNSGLIKTYEYDSVIIGSSMVQNFILDEVATIPGFSKPIKLSTHGGTIIEEMATLNHAIETGKVKSVLMGFDLPFSLVTYDRDFPFYLYDFDYWNDFFYLSNIDTLKRSIIYPIVSNVLPSGHPKLNYNRMYEWQSSNSESDFDEEKVRASFTKELQKPNDLKMIFENQNHLKAFNLFQMTLLSSIEKNPKVEFIIFFPPYSKLFYDLIESGGYLESFFDLKNAVKEELSQHKNVKVYDFYKAKEITNNLNNYRDYTHYHQKITTWMVSEMKKEASKYGK